MEEFRISFWMIALVALLILVVSTVMFLASRYRRCPSDMILVVFGKVGEGQSARCIHGGGALIWPLIQEAAYLRLPSL